MHIERLLDILKSSSQSRLPLQVKKSMEFNPVLGRYLDADRDQKEAVIERRNSIEELKRNKVRPLFFTDNLAQHYEKGALKV